MRRSICKLVFCCSILCVVYSRVSGSVAGSFWFMRNSGLYSAPNLMLLLPGFVKTNDLGDSLCIDIRYIMSSLWTSLTFPFVYVM